MDGEHHIRAGEHRRLLPDTEQFLLALVKGAAHDLEKDVELVQGLFTTLQGAKQQVEHILAKGLIHGHTPFTVTVIFPAMMTFSTSSVTSAAGVVTVTLRTTETSLFIL